jgi:16S rRNA (cytidine1402-2'-O)-methyltransferase
VARELTKVHEQIVRGTLDELSAAVADGTIPSRGEVAIVVGMRTPVARGQGSAGAGPGGASAHGSSSDAAGERGAGPDLVVGDDAAVAARAEVERLVADGVARGDAARRVAAATGIPRRQLYGGGPAPETADEVRRSSG